MPDPVTPEGAQPEPVITVPAGDQQQQQPPAPTPDPGDNFFTKEQVNEAIEKARAQEKDKLYPRIERMASTLEAFEQERAEQARIRQEEADRIAAEQRAREEEELSVRELLAKKEDEWSSKITEVEQTWQERFDAIKAERDAHAALLEQERQFQELNSFRERRLREEEQAGNIPPEFFPLVRGNSAEELEASISAVAAATSAMVENIQQTRSPGVRPVPATGAAPNEGAVENLTGQKTYTMADLKAMSPSEYAANRDALMAAVRRS